VKPISVKIFLVDGTPDGLRVVERSNWTGQALVCSRAQFPNVKRRAEFNKTGVYLLLGPEEDGSLPLAYIGEGDPVKPRLDAHEKTKDFWETMIVFSSKDGNLNKAHIQFIESRLIEMAQKAKRCRLDNGNAPARPALSEADQADMEAFVDDMRIIYSVLGVKIFDIANVFSTDSGVKDSEKLEIHAGGELLAEGYDRPEGFVVTSGSKCLAKEAPSWWEGSKKFRNSLKKEGVLTEVPGGHLIFSQDYVFTSPSRAAEIILGRAANGRTEWKTASGMTLKEIQDAS
jgi:hypothetical protein